MRFKNYISEAKQSFVFQEWLFSWYDLKFFKTLKEAQTFGQKRYNNIVKRNKKAEKDWRPNAYGVEQIHPTRIVDKSLSPFKYYPGTEEDKKNWNKYKKQYLQEAKTDRNFSDEQLYRLSLIQIKRTATNADMKRYKEIRKILHKLTIKRKKTNKPTVILPTDAGWKEVKKHLKEAKIKYVKKPDFMIAMGIDPDYSIREVSPDVFQIAKFTHGKEPAEVYRCEWTGKTWRCNCPSRKKPCKHIGEVQKFVKGKKKSVFDKWAKK